MAHEDYQQFVNDCCDLCAQHDDHIYDSE